MIGGCWQRLIGRDPPTGLGFPLWLPPAPATDPAWPSWTVRGPRARNRGHRESPGGVRRCLSGRPREAALPFPVDHRTTTPAPGVHSSSSPYRCPRRTVQFPRPADGPEHEPPPGVRHPPRAHLGVRAARWIVDVSNPEDLMALGLYSEAERLIREKAGSLDFAPFDARLNVHAEVCCSLAREYADLVGLVTVDVRQLRAVPEEAWCHPWGERRPKEIKQDWDAVSSFASEMVDEAARTDIPPAECIRKATDHGDDDGAPERTFPLAALERLARDMILTLPEVRMEDFVSRFRSLVERRKSLDSELQKELRGGPHIYAHAVLALFADGYIAEPVFRRFARILGLKEVYERREPFSGPHGQASSGRWVDAPPKERKDIVLFLWGRIEAAVNAQEKEQQRLRLVRAVFGPDAILGDPKDPNNRKLALRNLRRARAAVKRLRGKTAVRPDGRGPERPSGVETISMEHLSNLLKGAIGEDPGGENLTARLSKKRIKPNDPLWALRQDGPCRAPNGRVYKAEADRVIGALKALREAKRKAEEKRAREEARIINEKVEKHLASDDF